MEKHFKLKLQFMKKERICQEFTNGSKEYSDWKIVNSVSKEVVINEW